MMKNEDLEIGKSYVTKSGHVAVILGMCRRPATEDSPLGGDYFVAKITDDDGCDHVWKYLRFPTDHYANSLAIVKEYSDDDSED